MPPSVSKGSLRALSRCRSSTSIPIRSFSTTSPVSAIGPENPKFIEVPTTLQPQAIPRKELKGTLPPPRDIFSRSSGVKKLMKSIDKPTLIPVEPATEEGVEGVQGVEGAEVVEEVAEVLPEPEYKAPTSAEEAAEDRIALKKFFEGVTFEPGEKVDYNSALEKAKEAIIARAHEIHGRPDRAHELESLRRHAHQLKTWPKYFKQVTPEPKSQSEPANDYVAWKRRMAASRRENLRTGLVNLSYRKAAREVGVAHGSRERIREREKALYAPQREDDRLTATTVIKAVSALQTGASVPDPNREARVAASKARVEANFAARELQRRDALHTLYMHARDFIVTEQQLDDEVERIFTDTPFGKDDYRSNIWDAQGSPITVGTMLFEVNGTQKEAMKYHRGGAAKTSQRMKKISEELTGGRMD